MFFSSFFLVPRCCSESQQTAISSVTEPRDKHKPIDCHVTILCACVQITKIMCPKRSCSSERP